MSASMGSDNPVALLVFQDELQPDTEWPYPIFANQEFDVGRQLLREACGVEDRAVSSHHLRIRCIMYEDDDEHNVPPMVYVRVLSSHGAVVKYNGIGDADGQFIGQGGRDILLNDGDCVQMTHNVCVRFEANNVHELESPRLDRIRQAEIRRFSQRYLVSERVLGVGGFASVFLAVKQSNLQQVACKILPLSFLRSNSLSGERTLAEERQLQSRLKKKREKLTREYNVLKTLRHPNVISLEKVYCTTYNVYIFQEFITGGDLLSYLEKDGPLQEPQAAVITRQVLEAVKYLHANNVVHRDIKPENILMTSWREGARIVLTDFGQARTLEDANAASKEAGVFRMQSLVGTYGYTAPEVFRYKAEDAYGDPIVRDGSGYSKSIDMWSIGCLTATLVTNDLIIPQGEALRTTPGTLSQHAAHLAVLDTGRIWQSVGRRAKSFIAGCLAMDDNARLTAEQGLAHAWFTHPQLRGDFDAAYARAIQGWQPREHGEDLIEMLDTTDVLPANSAPTHPVRSHRFPAPFPAQGTSALALRQSPAVPNRSTHEGANIYTPNHFRIPTPPSQQSTHGHGVINNPYPTFRPTYPDISRSRYPHPNPLGSAAWREAGTQHAGHPEAQSQQWAELHQQTFGFNNQPTNDSPCIPSFSMPSL